jgi:four helix bundle protein
MKSYKELMIWKKSMNMVTDIYNITNSFPKDEGFGLTKQLRRSAISVASNIAEGYGRYQTKDFIRFLAIARGSLYEFQTQVYISNNINLLNENLGNILIDQSIEIDKMINSLIKQLLVKLNKS